MSTEEDWAPLPADGQTAHPGELAPAPSPAPPKPAAPVSRTAKPTAATAVLTPAQQQALRDFEARLAKAGPAKSLIANVLHREQADESRRAAAEAAARAASAPADSAQAPEPVGPISIGPGAGGDIDGRDALASTVATIKTAGPASPAAPWGLGDAATRPQLAGFRFT